MISGQTPKFQSSVLIGGTRTNSVAYLKVPSQNAEQELYLQFLQYKREKELKQREASQNVLPKLRD